MALSALVKAAIDGACNQGRRQLLSRTATFLALKD
jgi:hypothetical protein